MIVFFLVLFSQPQFNEQLLSLDLQWINSNYAFRTLLLHAAGNSDLIAPLKIILILARGILISLKRVGDQLWRWPYLLGLVLHPHHLLAQSKIETPKWGLNDRNNCPQVRGRKKGEKRNTWRYSRENKHCRITITT